MTDAWYLDSYHILYHDHYYSDPILEKGLVSLHDSHVVGRLFGQVKAHLPSRH